jgi:hypothetical protein
MHVISSKHAVRSRLISASQRVSRDERRSIGKFIAIGLLAIAAAGFGAPSARGQGNVLTLWNNTYGNALTSNAQAAAIAGDGDGDAVVTGWACSDLACSDQEALTVKFNHSVIEWKAWLSSPEKKATGVAVKLDPEGNAYVLYELTLATGKDMALAKYNATGVRQWITYVGGAQNPSLALSPDGNSYVSYVLPRTSPGTQSVMVNKYDATGKLVWENEPSLTGSTADSVDGFGIDAKEDVFVLLAGNAGHQAIFEFQANGDLARTFGSASTVQPPPRFCVDGAGATYEATVVSPGAASVTKFNPDGTEAWTTQPSTAQVDNVAAGVVADPAGDVFVGATTEDAPPVNGDSNLSVLKFDSAGKFQWIASYNDHSFGSLAASYATSIIVNNEGDAYLLGVDANKGQPGNAGPIPPATVLVLKFDTTGGPVWISNTGAPLGLTDQPVALTAAGGELLVLTNAVQPVASGFGAAQGSEWTPFDLVQDAVTLSTNTLNFGSQKTGTASAAQTVTVGNTAETPLAIHPVIAGNTADFRVTNNCPASIPAFSTCTVSVVFAPTASGSAGLTITVKDDWEGNGVDPQLITVNVSGTGTN